MTGQELATAVQEELPIVVLVVNNGMYGTIRMHQERRYPGRVVGTDLRNPDFAALARAYGAHGALVERTEEFGDALDEALECGRPALIELRVDPQAITPRQTLDEIRGRRPLDDARARGDRGRRGWRAPISHYDTTRSSRGDALYISGIVPVDGEGHSWSGERRRRPGAGRCSRSWSRCSPRRARAPADVVKVIVYLLDIDDRPRINPVRQEFFGETRPASTLVEVSRLAVDGRAGWRSRPSRTWARERRSVRSPRRSSGSPATRPQRDHRAVRRARARAGARRRRGAGWPASRCSSRT